MIGPEWPLGPVRSSGAATRKPTFRSGSVIFSQFRDWQEAGPAFPLPSPGHRALVEGWLPIIQRTAADALKACEDFVPQVNSLRVNLNNFRSSQGRLHIFLVQDNDMLLPGVFLFRVTQ